MGRVIPSFSVLSALVVLTIPIYLIILSYKHFFISSKRRGTRTESGNLKCLESWVIGFSHYI